MKIPLIVLLLIFSALRIFLDFSHIILLGLVGFSVAALSNDASSLTVGICLGGMVLGIASIQTARSMKTVKALSREQIKKDLLQFHSPTEAELRITLAYLTVLIAGSMVVLSLIGSWEALLVVICGNGIAWLFGKIFVGLTLRTTSEATKSVRRRLKPWRNMAVDAIPLATFILGLAFFPNLLGFKAIPIYLILRHTCRHLLQLSLQSGMEKHFQTFS